MNMCGKEEGHFDLASFWFGFLIPIVAAAIVIAIISPSSPSTAMRKEAELPKKCSVGEQVLMTTAPTAELYICESVWKRR